MGSVYLFNGARYLLAALIVLPLAFRADRSLNPAARVFRFSRDQYKWMAIAGFLLFLGSAFQQAGMVYTTAGNAGFITSLYVVLVPVLLYFFWGEKPHWISIFAVVLAGTGAFLLSTGGKFSIKPGDLLELIGALFWTFHVVVLGKHASRFEPLSFSVGQLFVCAVLNIGVGLIVEPITIPTPALFFAIAYTAIFSLGICYTLQIWAQRHTPPADAAIILSMESVFAVVSGWLLLDERLILIQIVGCVMIFFAVMLSQFKEWNSGTIDHEHLVEGR